MLPMRRNALMKTFVSTVARKLLLLSRIPLLANLLHDFGYVSVDFVWILVGIGGLQIANCLEEQLFGVCSPLRELCGREDRGDGLTVLLDQHRLLLAAHRVECGVEVRVNVVQGLAHSHHLAPADLCRPEWRRIIMA